MTKDEMVEWFKSAPDGSRHERILWTARKIARLTGATEGGSYQVLLLALIEAERQPPDDVQAPELTAQRQSWPLLPRAAALSPLATVPKSHARSTTPKTPTTRGSRPRRIEGPRRRISEPKVASDI